jgi:hypothetical protein
VTELITEITEEGIRLPRALLEECGYAAGQRLLVVAGSDGLRIRPAEPAGDEIINLALRHLWRTTGDALAVEAAEECPAGWRVRVLLTPAGQPLGELYFNREGALLEELSTPPQRMVEAANAA